MPLALLLVLGFDFLVMAPLTAWLARERGRSTTAWLVLGALLGPFALFAVGLAPGLDDGPRPHRPMAVPAPDQPPRPAASIDAWGRSRPETPPHGAPVASAQTAPTPEIAGPAPSTRLWAPVPWSRLDVATGPTAEATAVARAVAGLTAPSQILFDQDPAAPTAASPTRVRAARNVGHTADEIDEDQPLRLRQRRPASSTAATRKTRPKEGSATAGSARRTGPVKGAGSARDIGPARVSPALEAPIRLVPPWTANQDVPGPGDTRPAPAPRLQSVPGRPSRATRPLRTASSERAAAARSAVPPPLGDTDEASASICVAVFLGGMPELAIGERYLLEVDPRGIVVSEAVAITRRPFSLRIPLTGVSLVEFEDRFVVGCQPDPGRQVHLAFRGTPTARVRTRLLAAQAAAGQPLTDESGSAPRPGRSSSAGR